MNDEQQITAELKRRHTINAADAREQASEEFGFLRSTYVNVAGEVFEIPHKDLFDPEQQERFDELASEVRTYDHEPDITASDGTIIRKGDPILPHHKNGKLVKPPYSQRLGVVLWGKDGADRYRQGGGNFNLIEITWARQARELAKWREADSKSVGRDSGLEAVSD